MIAGVTEQSVVYQWRGQKVKEIIEALLCFDSVKLFVRKYGGFVEVRLDVFAIIA